MSYIRHITVLLAGLAGAMLAVGAAAPSTLAIPLPPGPGRTKAVPPPAIHTTVTGGMPGQIRSGEG